jgi:hypothetical protein
VVGNGIATVFPQAVGMAAAWAPDMIHEEATVVVQKVVIHDETLPIYYFGPPERSLNGKQPYWSSSQGKRGSMAARNSASATESRQCVVIASTLRIWLSTWGK